MLAACAPGDDADTRALSYNWDVRPILANNCFRCHGPDAAAREAGLRLDVEGSATAELPDSPGRFAIIRGKPQSSELVRRVTSPNADFVMPPPRTHLALSKGEIDTLARWISEGAPYQPHWSFISPTKVEPRRSASLNRAVNPIDAFVFASAEQHGLTPSPEADRETLLHRVTFTLTGLPATPDEVGAFVKDLAPEAYERVVDRLLASPAYGERMASDWLDGARFADSDGYLDDEYRRLLYPWRDWVIKAFNDNLSYETFGSWQLAGDLLPNATHEQRLATAFGRLHRRSAENGIIDEEYRTEYVIDRTDTLGTAFLGLSVGCARCHDHKFDPISHVDYYSLTAFFNSTDDAGFYPQEKWDTGPTLLLTDEADDQRIAELRARIAALESDYTAALRTATAAAASGAGVAPQAVVAAVENSLKTAELAHYSFDTARSDTALEPRYRSAVGIEPSQPLRFSPAVTRGLRPAVLQAPQLRPGIRGNALYFDDNNKGFIDKADKIGWFDHEQSFSVDFWLYADHVYTEAAVLNHSDHLRFGSGGWSIDLENNRVKVQLVHAYPRDQITVISPEPLPERAWKHLTLTYDGSAKAGGVALYVDGTPVALETRRDGLTQSMLPLGLAFAGLDGFNGLSFGKRWQQSPLVGGALDELRVFDRQLTPLEAAFLHDGASALERGGAAAAFAAHSAALAPEVRSAAAALSAARGELNRLLTSLREVMTMGDTAEPRPSYVLGRGVFDQHREQVFPRGLEQIFAYPDDYPRNRLGLAQWLFDPQNPLTARVYVNRLWQMHFGTGLVRTAEEFGTQGTVPTHPYLLDWLAVEFIESGWDIKALNKLIVMSATFRQSSDMTAAQLAADPENVYLARGVVRRLSAEMLRDHALAASGLLDRTLGGPSVYPYQPDGVWESVNIYTRAIYPRPESVPRDQHRRSVYTLIRRGAPVPSMSVFDFPRRHTSQVRRNPSNTPLQALVLLNDPQYVEASRALAERAIAAADDLDQQLAALFHLAARRTPSTAELGALREFYTAELAAFRQSAAAAERYLDVGVVPAQGGIDHAHLAALASTANVALNTPDSYLLR